ncbi:MAG: hypothetical protein KA240_16590, partial [Nitrospira sp.]|nr:hypothetical protein [Nitrospira sp.]
LGISRQTLYRKMNR